MRSQHWDTGLFGSKTCLCVLVRLTPLCSVALGWRIEWKLLFTFSPRDPNLSSNYFNLKCMTVPSAFFLEIKGSRSLNMSEIQFWNCFGLKSWPACHAHFLDVEGFRSIGVKEMKLCCHTKAWCQGMVQGRGTSHVPYHRGGSGGWLHLWYCRYLPSGVWTACPRPHGSKGPKPTWARLFQHVEQLSPPSFPRSGLKL